MPFSGTWNLKSFLETNVEPVPDLHFGYVKFAVRRPGMNRRPSYLPAKWCRPSLGEDILKPIQLLRGILPPYGWPRPCSLPRGAWIRVTRLSTELPALPLLFILTTAQLFGQIPQIVTLREATKTNPGCWQHPKEWICGRKLQQALSILLYTTWTHIHYWFP